MKISERTLRNASITIVANRLHTSFISSSFFDFLLTSPINVVQVPPFGLMNFGKFNCIVDVENRRVLINDTSGSVIDSPIPRMAKKVISVPNIEVVAVGFNYAIDLTFDSEFGKYSVDEFLTSKYKSIFEEELAGIGVKVFIKKGTCNITLNIEPNISESMHAVVGSNFHYEIPYGIDFEKEFIEQYNKVEEYINGFFS